MHTVHAHAPKGFARGLALLLVAITAAPAAWAAIGAGSLYVAGATNTPTHWNVPIGVPTTAEIRGVSTSEVGSPLPASITIYVKSSHFGNTVLTATQIGATSDYTFTWTPPAIAQGDLFDACSTTIVAYQDLGLNSNNDLLDDGLQNGSQNAGCGFRFIDAQGDVIPCEVVGVGPTTWSSAKQLYR